MAAGIGACSTDKTAQSAFMHLKTIEQSSCDFSRNILTSNVAILHFRKHFIFFQIFDHTNSTEVSFCLSFRGAHDVLSVCSGDSGLSLGWIAHGLQISVDADPPCYLQYLSGKNMHTT